MLLTTLHHLGDMDILDRAGQKMGRVRDVLLDASTGRCEYLLVSADGGGPFGNLGATSNLTPVPLSLFSMKDRVLSMDATRDIFKGAPSFSASDIGTFTPDYLEKLNSFWGIGGGHRTRTVETTTGTPERPLGTSTAEERPYDTRPVTEHGEEPPFRRSA